LVQGAKDVALKLSELARVGERAKVMDKNRRRVREAQNNNLLNRLLHLRIGRLSHFGDLLIAIVLVDSDLGSARLTEAAPNRRAILAVSVSAGKELTMSTTTPLRTIPAAHLTFDYETVLALARHLSPDEQDRLIDALRVERARVPADPEALRRSFAEFDAESAADPPTAEEDAAYDAMLARLNGKQA
jgi:hypothetical protein